MVVFSKGLLRAAVSLGALGAGALGLVSVYSLNASTPRVKFTYFNLRGKGELSRLMLLVAGVDFEDNRIDADQWARLKPDTPFGQLPLLEWENAELAQSMSIVRYIARKTGLAGATPEEEAKADMIAEHCGDVLSKILQAHFTEDPEIKAKLVENFKTTVLPNFLKTSETLLEKNGGEFFTGRNLSYGDVYMAFILDTLMTERFMRNYGFPDLPRISSWEYKRLTKLHERVFSIPAVKAYVNRRPESTI